MTLAKDLEQFTGTENYYKASPWTPIVITDGVKYFADKGGAWWAVDDILINATPLNKSFLSVEVESKDNKATITYSDGDYNVLLKHEYPITDLENGTYKFFITNYVMMLTSEY